MPVGGIVLVIGLPATGKTTLCKALSANTYTKVWSLDEYPDTDTLRTKNDQIFQMVSNSLHENHNSIHVIDDTFHLKSMRKRYVSLAKEQKVGLAFIHLDSSLKELLQRNRCRDGRIDDAVILKMARSFEPLCSSHQCYAVSSMSENLWADIIEKLTWSQEFHREIAEVPKIGEMESQNNAHKLSLLLNQAVSDIMIDTPADQKKAKAQSLVPLKQKTFADLKSRLHDDDTILTAITSNNSSFFTSLLQDALNKQK